jgi:WD40 repeat protein
LSFGLSFKLAVGFEKTRNDHSILVWDIRVLSSEKSNAETSQFSTANAETVVSLTWHPRDENILLSGFSNNSLRLYDIRSNMKPIKTNTKYTNSFVIDPFASNNAASYYEVKLIWMLFVYVSNYFSVGSVSFQREIALWDIRHFDEPVDIIKTDNDVLKIEWCHKKCSKLATLTDYSNEMNIFAIKPDFVFESLKKDTISNLSNGDQNLLAQMKLKSYDKIDSKSIFCIQYTWIFFQTRNPGTLDYAFMHF